MAWPRFDAVALAAGLALWAGACAGDESAVVSVVLLPGSAPSPTTETTSLGYQVTLTRAYLATASVELLPCETASVRRRLSDWLIADAHAHTESSPTRLGTPVVESLLPTAGAAPSRRTLGQLNPPAGRYCQVRQRIAAADGDALGLPADVDLVGLSMLLEGTFAGPGQPARRFTLRSTLAFDATIDIAPTDLGPSRRRATLLLDKAWGHWLDNVPFEAGTATDQARVALANLRSALRVTLE